MNLYTIQNLKTDRLIVLEDKKIYVAHNYLYTQDESIDIYKFSGEFLYGYMIDPRQKFVRARQILPNIICLEFEHRSANYLYREKKLLRSVVINIDTRFVLLDNLNPNNNIDSEDYIFTNVEMTITNQTKDNYLLKFTIIKSTFNSEGDYALEESIAYLDIRQSWKFMLENPL